MIFTLQMTKWKLRVRWLIQSYTSSKWQSQDSNSGLPNSKACSLKFSVSFYTVSRRGKETHEEKKLLVIQQINKKEILTSSKYLYSVFQTRTKITTQKVWRFERFPFLTHIPWTAVPTCWLGCPHQPDVEDLIQYTSDKMRFILFH